VKVQIDRLIALCELSGCAVAPIHVAALIEAVRRYSALAADLAAIVMDAGCIDTVTMDALSDRMEAARTCQMPDLS
jgi:hypothetical protein